MDGGTEGSAGIGSLSSRSGRIGNCAGSGYPSELEPPLATGASLPHLGSSSNSVGRTGRAEAILHPLGLLVRSRLQTCPFLALALPVGHSQRKLPSGRYLGTMSATLDVELAKFAHELVQIGRSCTAGETYPFDIKAKSGGSQKPPSERQNRLRPRGGCGPPPKALYGLQTANLGMSRKSGQLSGSQKVSASHWL